MFILRILKEPVLSIHRSLSIIPTRTFLSQAYYCNEVWEHRLKNPILNKVNVNDLYQELDNRFAKVNQISAIDVDIFANAVKDEFYIEELTDLIHKFRLTASASNILDSTSHAIVRFLLHHRKYEELLKILDDRLNYGIFLDYYTSNILMDTFYKSDNFTLGAHIASQLMLQEELEHPLSVSLGLLHCYKYLIDPKDWPRESSVEEPEEEIKIRVKYLRNPYFDDHFDLNEPRKIIGKTLWMSTKDKDSILENSLHVLGLELHGKTEKASEMIRNLISSSKKVYADILNILPEENAVRKAAVNITQPGDIEQLLFNNVQLAERNVAEKDIAIQCEKYSKWEHERKEALEKQHEKLLIQQKLVKIENIQKELKERETKLWFFENEEKIELAIEAKKIFYPKRWFGKKKKPKKIDEGYVPPEVK